MIGNIGNAYLESYMNEKVVFTAGCKFEELESHTLVIIKAYMDLEAVVLDFMEH